MGMIDEGRQLIQDFVTPEIRLIDARLTALERRVESFEAKVDKRFDAFETSVDKRFDAVDKRFDSFETAVDKRFDSLEGKMEHNQAQVLDTLRRMENYTLVMERLARLESKIQNVA